MKFTLDGLKDLVEQSLKEEPTGDRWLDNRCNEDIPIIGHTQPYYKLFHLISKMYRPKFVVELGSWRATAAAHFASGCPTADVVTIDIHREDAIAHAKAKDAASHYENLQFIHGWTWDDWVVDAVRANPFPIYILFIDAWHEYEKVMREWNLYSPMLADEALIICDDIFDSSGTTIDMVKFWDGLDYEKFLDDRVHPGIPMGFVRFIR